MNDQDKSREELLGELADLRERTAALEASLANQQDQIAYLEQSEAKWRSVAANAATFIAVVDGSGTIQFINHTVPGLRIEDVIGKTMFDYVHPQYHDALREHLRFVFQEGDAGTVELIGDGPNGSEAWYETYLGPVTLEGQVVAATMTAIDVTERKRAENALRENERRLATLMSNLPGMVYRCQNDSDWTMEFISEGCVSLTGYPPSAFLGNDEVAYGQIIHRDDREQVWSEVQQAIAEGRRFQLEYRIHAAAGMEKWVWEQGTGIYSDSGQVESLEGLITDITARKRAESALQESEERFRQAMEATHDGLWDWNVKTGEVYYSPAYSRMLGYEPAEFANSVRSWIDLLHPDDRAAAIEKNQACVENRIPNFEVEFRMQARNVEWKTILGRGKAVCRDANGLATRMIGTHVDITERKRAEEALRKAKDELELRVEERTADLRKINQELEIHRLFAQNATQCFGIADLGGIVRYVNPAFCRLVEEERIEDIVGQPFFKYGRTTEYVKNDYLPALLKEGRWEKEGFLRTRQGNSVPVWNSSFLIRDGEGQPAFIATILTDISERKKAENVLRESEERFRSYFEQGLMGMAVSDDDMRWTEVNDRFCEILGYSRSEVFRQKILDFVHPDDFEVAEKAFRQLLSGEIGHYTTNRRYLRKDGQAIHLNIYVKGYRSAAGMVDHVLALFEDVTERKRAEEALQASETQYRQIFESVTDALFIFDLEGKVVAANPAACTAYGYSQEEIIGLSGLQLITPDYHHLFAAFRQQIATQGFFYGESVDVRKDGTTMNVEVRVSGFLFRDKPHLLAVVRNIDERKRAEEALQKEQRTLKHLLQSSDHERQTIAYEIHDGLAQYLASSIMQFDVYKHHLEKKPNDAAKAYDSAMTLLRQGHSEARRLIAGIRHPVLDEAGVVEAVAHLISERNREKGRQIAFHSLVEFSRLVPLLENAIYRIIQEGLTNACKYSQSSRVRVSLLQQKDRLRIEIRDWGIGFDTNEVKEGSYGLAGIRERARLLGGKF